MHKLLKMIPTTPDMVSLWLPSGQNRAMDIIRGNHGQCYGTHPNVPALPNVINASLGWHFDGDDDWIAILTSSLPKANSEKTIGAWIKRKSVGVQHPILSTRINFGGVDNMGNGYIFRVAPTNKLEYGHTGIGTAISTSTLDTNWHFATATVGINAATPKLYLNGVLEILSANDLAQANDELANGYTGVGSQAGVYGDAYICMLFTADQIWSVAQVNNFYLATRSFFSPRG